MARWLPFDVDGEEPLDLCGAAAHGGGEGLALAVAEEQHLQHVGVVHRHAAARHLPVGVLVMERAQTKYTNSVYYGNHNVSKLITRCKEWYFPDL